MAIRKFYSERQRNIIEGNYDNFESELSYNPKNTENLNIKEWSKFISYYRYYIDEFACDILGLKLYPFQRLILRAMARYQTSMFIACRGLGKSYLTAVFFICSAILYPGIKCGIASGNGQQAKNVIIQKIKGELIKNENIAREISFPIKTGSDDCVVNFKNGSEIRAIVLAQEKGGDSARSWRFHFLLCDESRLIRDSIVEEILIPMTKTKRPAAIHHNQPEKGKVIFISSAYLKTSDLYKRFRYHYEQMMDGSQDYFVCTLPYQVGVQAGIFEEEDILKELDKPSNTKDKFSYEYEAVFVGSSGESYYPYELTVPCRKIEKCELEQPKKSNSIYVITHDVAVSDARNSDNACTHVIKLKERANGTFSKKIVYTKTVNGIALNEQRDMLRDLIHIKYPNTNKVIIDTMGSGAGLPSMFYESWEYTDPKTKQVIEYPPIIKDDDIEGTRLKDALPLIRAVTATGSFNAEYYPYMKSCFEDRSLELLVSSSEVDGAYKEGLLTAEEFAQHIEHDILISELSNIKQCFTENGNLTYAKIVKSKKRDRATSLMYGLSYVYELEIENRQNLYKDNSDDFEFLSGYIY